MWENICHRTYFIGDVNDHFSTGELLISLRRYITLLTSRNAALFCSIRRLNWPFFMLEARQLSSYIGLALVAENSNVRLCHRIFVLYTYEWSVLPEKPSVPFAPLENWISNVCPYTEPPELCNYVLRNAAVSVFSHWLATLSHRTRAGSWTVQITIRRDGSPLEMLGVSLV